MSEGIKTVIYPVRDLERAKAVFSALLESEPIMDQPYYVQFDAKGQDLGLDPNGHSKGMTGPVSYWHVADIRGRVAALTAAGATVTDDVKDVGGGKLIATLTDADGNVIGLLQPA
ncbi:VOC family protein [Dactylosporangium sp. NPDC048998]|uniref:VOC family protein n=1 Tax=Dactylosporangium sp. NPDC048998 TaxID=3363976 RepID=UPI003717181A